MAIFGNNANGTSWVLRAPSTVGHAGIAAAYLGTLAVGDVINTVHGRLAAYATGTLHVGVYLMSGGLPSTKVADAVLSCDASGTMKDYDSSAFNFEITTAGDYCVAVGNCSSSGAGIYVATEDPSTNGISVYNTAGALPDTWAHYTYLNYSPRIWATYTVGGGGGATPEITDVDTDESFSVGQESVVIAGTGFNDPQGTGSVLLVDGSITSGQSVVSWADVSISFDAALGDCRYGARTLRVTNSDDNFDEIAVTITVPSGKAFIDLTSVNETAENRITATPDLAAGDQLEISNVQGGTIADVTLYADATFDCAESVTAFDVRANDGTGWGAIATQTVSAPGAVASATTSTVQAAPTAVYADGVTASTITATVRDASSNPLSGKVVTLADGGGSSIITTVQGTTDVDGHAVFTVVDDTAETVVYTATVTTDSVQISQTAQVEFATPPGGSAEDDQPTQNVTIFFYAQ